MTVAELIAELQKLPQDAPVVVTMYDPNWGPEYRDPKPELDTVKVTGDPTEQYVYRGSFFSQSYPLTTVATL